MKKIIRITNRLFLIGICILSVSMTYATEAIDTTKITQDNKGYKDSFYFNWGNKHYLAVSDISRGGISVLIGGSNGTKDKDYQLHQHIGGTNSWAPYVYNYNGILWFVTTHFSYNNSYLKAFTYNPINKSVGTVHSDRSMQGDTDATIFWHNNHWYLFTAQWHSDYLGSKLVWRTSSTSPITGYGSATPLKDQNGNEIDRLRTDIDYVVEAPHIGWNPQTALGSSSLTNIYWSVGPSDPTPLYTSAVRRGDLNFTKNTGTPDTPWIYVFGDVNGSGSGNMVSSPASGMDENHLTHPDTTAAGYIRATSMKNGTFNIVNSTHR